MPHTGAHTIQALFGAECEAIRHFGWDDSAIWNIPVQVVVPLRDPLATALTWRARQTDEDRSPALLNSLSRCMEYCVTHAPWVVPVEGIPVRENRAENPYGALFDQRKVPDLPEVRALRKWIGGREWFWTDRGYELWWR